MNCREAVEHLYEYLDKELTPDAVRTIGDQNIVEKQQIEDCK